MDFPLHRRREIQRKNVSVPGWKQNDRATRFSSVFNHVQIPLQQYDLHVWKNTVLPSYDRERLTCTRISVNPKAYWIFCTRVQEAGGFSRYARCAGSDSLETLRVGSNSSGKRLRFRSLKKFNYISFQKKESTRNNDYPRIKIDSFFDFIPSGSQNIQDPQYPIVET